MDLTTIWKGCFEAWPADLPRRGVLVTTFDEQIAFQGFMTHAGMVLIERNAPDTTGARKLLVPYQHVAALKIVDPVKGQLFTPMGFQGDLPGG